MFPALSPFGASQLGEVGAEVSLATGFQDFLQKENWNCEDLSKVLSSFRQCQIRLTNRERLGAYLSKHPKGFLKMTDRGRLLQYLPYTKYKGLRAAAEKLLASPCEDISRVQRTWEWLDTVMQLSLPPGKETTEFRIRWWILIVHDIVSSHSTHYACKKWSSFCLWCHLHYGGAIQPLPEWEEWFPRLPRDTWMQKEPAELTRLERAYYRLLSDKRGLPSGDHVTCEEALAEHTKTLTKNPTCPLTDDQIESLKYFSSIAAKEVKKHVSEKGIWFSSKSGHVSLSNSSCFEMTRSLGGKRKFVLQSLRSWLTEIPEESKQTVLPTGQAFFEEAGSPRWRTVRPPGMSPAENPFDGVRFSTGLLTEDFVDGEQERVGFQLFCWSFSYLQSRGFIDRNGRATGRPMPISRIAIPEPGCKVRVATRSQAAFILYGQPFAHAFRELLEFHPGLKAGLSSGYQLWEWLKPQGSEPLPKYVMAGDFDSATDHIDHTAGRLAMEILIKEIGGGEGYASNFVSLLFTPRYFSENGVVTTTNSGCLMGEPGTKIVLTFLALVAQCYVRKGNSSKYFATAGDDQIDADNDPCVLLQYAEASQITTMVPSMKKWGIFKHSLVYCQQLLHIEATADKGEISIPKPRLLSKEQKGGRGDLDTNPAYGKARQFSSESSWCEYPDLVGKMLFLFLRNMRPFIEYSYQLFLPREWGGLGLPLGKNLTHLLPPWHQSLIRAREEGLPAAGDLLSRWSTSRNFKRGIVEFDGADSIYLELLEFVPQAQLDQLDLDVLPTARYQEKLKAAAREGWIPLRDLLSKVKESQTYASMWHIDTEVDRGFKSLSWKERNRRMEEAAKSLTLPPPTPTLGLPSWKPVVLVLAEQLGYLVISEDVEDGEIPEFPRATSIQPIMGSTAGPRLFLHYDNNRLILNAVSRKRHPGEQSDNDSLKRTKYTSPVS